MDEIRTILKKHCLNIQNINALYNELNEIYLTNYGKDMKKSDKARVLSSAIFEIKKFLIEYEK